MERLLSCDKCALKNSRTSIVNGIGPKKASIMLIGEAPGEIEDLTGEPFTGKSGQALDYLLQQVEMIREECYITNVVKCRPPQNRKPLQKEIEKCFPYLEAEIAEVNPKVIITLGATAMRAILKINSSLKTNMLRIFKYNGTAVIPTIHPADALKRQKDASFAAIIAALNIAKRILLGKNGTQLQAFNEFMAKSCITKANIEKLVANTKYLVLDHEDMPALKGVGLLFIKNDNGKEYVFLPAHELEHYKSLLFENISLKKMVYYAAAEADYLKRANIDLKGVVYDCYPAVYLYDENLPSYGLKFASSMLLAKENYGIEFETAKTKDALKYNYLDCLNTYLIYKKTKKTLLESNLSALFKRHTMPLLKIMQEISANGMYINARNLDLYLEALNEKAERLKEQLRLMLGSESFNPNSTKEIAKALKQLNINVAETTPTGSTKTSKGVLAKYKNPFIELLLQYKNHKKMIEMINSLKTFIREDGRIHARFLLGTETGRLSSQDPNMQNIPPELRTFFEAESGNLFVKMDFSQLELRVLAQVSNDKELQKAFESDSTDIHMYAAKLVFKDKATVKHRTWIKRIVFGLIYGMSIRRLAQELGISEKKAESIKRKLFKFFPAIDKYIQNTNLTLRKEKRLVNPFGRQRRFKYVYNRESFSKASREAVNFMVQSTASDIVQLFFIALRKRLNLEIKYINFVHDEMDIELKAEMLDELINAINLTAKEFPQMLYETFNFKLKLPLAIEMKIGHNWAMNGADIKVEKFVISKLILQ